ncbi:MAG TPA: hypothetical protein VJ203_03665 [Bacteroidales bacterium]|nr:hypothetical protein [Bacteroidales bacterium]
MNNPETGKFRRYDTLVTGIAGGILIPVAAYFILYFAKVQDIRFTLFSHHLVIGNIIPVIISHCVLPNLLLFFAFNGLNWMRAAKGVLGTTVVLTLVIFAIKLIFTLI